MHVGHRVSPLVQLNEAQLHQVSSYALEVYFTHAGDTLLLLVQLDKARLQQVGHYAAF
jgi:hypothetical protein